MDGPGWKWRSVAALSAGSLVAGTTAPIYPAAAATVETCSMQVDLETYCQQPSDEGPATVPQSTETDDGQDGDGDGLLGFIIAAAAILVGALLVKELTGGSDRSISDLERDGPKAPEREVLGNYEVQGLVYPRWPLVIEVNAEPGATTFVQVITKGGRKGSIPPLVLSDEGGAPWDSDEVIVPLEVERTERGVLARFELPAELDGNDRDGFHSARLAVASGRMQGDTFVYSPLEVLALGAGPTAVGSAAVVVSRFEPVPDTRRADYAVTFNARRSFNNLHAELIEREQSSRETRRREVASQDICLLPSGRDVCQSPPSSVPFRVDGGWPVNAGGELSTGKTYHMQLRAFTGRTTRDGGWIVSQAPKVVTWR
jgi:hypothetical protein